MKTIALVGGIGAGKTFWGQRIASYLGSCQFIEEDTTENLYLNEFYENMKKWGFHSRISMLSMVVSNIKKIDVTKEYVIFDRCVQELVVFAQKQHDEGNLSDKEFALYMQLYSGITNIIAEPDLYIFFHCSPQTSLSRVKKRSRGCESGVKIGFLEDVTKRYNMWRKSLDNRKVIDLDTEHDIDLNDLLYKIEEHFE